jgi:hypothetical protein
MKSDIDERDEDDAGERMGEESIRELGVDYSYVRYCETGSVPDAAADRAKTALNRIGRFKGKKTNEGNE